MPLERPLRDVAHQLRQTRHEHRSAVETRGRMVEQRNELQQAIAVLTERLADPTADLEHSEGQHKKTDSRTG